jgi:hypothetical protein
MKRRLMIRLGWTALASPLVFLLAGALSRVHLWWIAAPFVMPGVGVTALFTPKGAHMPDFVIFGLSEFLCNWILLFAVVSLFDRLIKLRREIE